MSGIIQIYDDVTGVFTKVAFATDRAAVTDVVRFINANLIAGHKAYAGSAVDVLSSKLDVVTGKLVEYRSAELQIAELERRQQRPLREFALGMSGAVERLEALNRQIAALR
jgi:hypothetical protein